MADEMNDHQVISRLFEQVNQHFETQWEYISLTSTEKIANLAASMAGMFTVFVFAILVLFFFSMGFAWWLGDFWGNRAGGFASSGLVFIPIAILFFRWVRPFVRAKVIQSILHDETTKKTTTNG